MLIDQAKALAGNVTPGDTPGFPVTISRSGSYRLSGNLTVPNENTAAIQITADNVTLDLNGFAILGATVCSVPPTTPPFLICSPRGTGRGVDAEARTNTTVTNGTARGMGEVGVFVTGDGSRVEEVHATSIGSIGIIARGTVTGNTATGNARDGNRASGTVTGNMALSNAGFELSLTSSHVGYTHNVMSGNIGGTVTGGVSLGQNLCNGVVC